MTQPPEDPLQQLGHELSKTLHQLGLLIEPIFDAADGVRNELERRAWSPSASEELAAEYVKLCLRRLFLDLEP